MTSSDTIRNSWNNFTSVAWKNLENGKWGWYGSPVGGTANHTDSTEAQVATLLWDLVDYANDDHGACPGQTPPDGVEDSLEYSFDDLMNVLLTKNAADGDLADDITEFQEAWIATTHNGHLPALQDIYYEHGIPCCFGKRGDANNSGSEIASIGDLAAIVYHFTMEAGPLPGCVEEANVDPSNSGINIADIIVMVDHLFVFHAPLPDCPCEP